MKWKDVSPEVLKKYKRNQLYISDGDCPLIDSAGRVILLKVPYIDVSEKFLQWFESRPELKQLQIEHMMR